MRRIVIIFFVSFLSEYIFAGENLLYELYSNEDIAREMYWNSTCLHAKLEMDNNELKLSSYGNRIFGDTILMVELYSNAPNNSPLLSFWSFDIKSANILYIKSDSSVLAKMQKNEMSCDYELYSIIKQRKFELLEKWDRCIIGTPTDTPSAKYFVTMFYKYDDRVNIRKWTFYRASVRRRLMEEYLLDMKNKGINLDYWMRDD
ncbi:MAG: hypothetical protein MJZ34_14865 [Paludibacteraceae bacterium]|nr:hypothetical protein [Paludibacteraceae bacterium]